jgi:sigma-B regulation protein RsbU (phosphoserine phosphatase)
MLDEDGLREMALECAAGPGGPEFLDDMFWRLTQVMSPDDGMGDDVSAVLFEYNGP